MPVSAKVETNIALKASMKRTLNLKTDSAVNFSGSVMIALTSSVRAEHR